jgi:hypothetical protein
MRPLRLWEDRWVPIVIRKVSGGYEAEVTPPHGQARVWETASPMSRDDLISALRDRGCHQTDIADAFHTADPDWLS